MKDIREVIALKQKQCAELKQQIDALTVAASLLGPPPLNDVTTPGVIEKRIPKVDAVLASPVIDHQTQHISDLRVLIDKSEARETILLDLVKMVMEERYFRPNITRPPSLNKTSSAIPPEHLSDVATFDEAADMAQSKEEGDLQTKLQSEFDSILTEHNEAHQEG